jgi:hypothetical protein
MLRGPRSSRLYLFYFCLNHFLTVTIVVKNLVCPEEIEFYLTLPLQKLFLVVAMGAYAFTEFCHQLSVVILVIVP